MISIAVIGATGRMGLAIVKAVESDAGFSISGGLVHESSADIGCDVGVLAGVGEIGVTATENLDSALAGADVVVDFSTADSRSDAVAHCARIGLPMVIGTTGLDDAQLDAITHAAGTIAIVHAANMSIGITLMQKLAALACQTLGDDFDIEIVETHHRDKKDAPSGTAIAIGEAIDNAGQASRPREIGRRPGDGPRTRGAVGYSSIRAGDVVGEHKVIFAGAGESLELTHKASSRMTFATGALRAASWVRARSAGLYDMSDVLDDE
jgi:4-hydroxy-tetrahydrodipicolinate reductase